MMHTNKKPQLVLNKQRAFYSVILLFAWCGAIGSNISYRVGGVAYYFIALLTLLMSLYPFQFVVPGNRKKLFYSGVYFAIFSIAYAVLSAVLLKITHFTSFLGFVIPVYSYNVIVNLPIWLACFFVVYRSDVNSIQSLLNLLFYILLYDIIITVFTLLYDPNFARNSTAGIVNENVFGYRFLGAMGYELTYATTMLIPLFFILGRMVSRKWYILSVLGAIYIFLSGFFIGVVALIINVSLSFVLGMKSKGIRWFLLLIFLILGTILLFSRPMVGNEMIKLSAKMEVSDLQRRIYQIGALFAFGDASGDSLIRFEMYNRSFSGILNSPLLGQLIFDREYILSDHSSLLDVWCGFGIVPFTLLIMSILGSCRFSIKQIKQKWIKNIIVASYITLCFVGLFNTLFAAPIIMLVPLTLVPMMAIQIGEKEKMIT